ncbi:MAG: enoyl-CoA hydratase family protein [Planctomycetes bacterium]|nr:enoyl-CoA hydratase family protein [Planctomycetota bacterium]
MSSEPHVRIQREDGLVTVILARPERMNALTFASYRTLCDFFADEAKQEATRVVILTGEGRGFCSGGDVNEIIGALRGAAMKETLEFAWMTGELIRNMRNFDRPVIAAINGTCAGAGAVMAAACDFRILAEESSIAFLFSKVGLTGADMGAAYLLPRLIGQARATEILMLGEPVKAAQALQWGLVTAVKPATEVLSAARELAQRLLQLPPLALRVTKRMLNNEWNMDLASAIESEAQAQALMMMGRDHTEFYDAWKAKRPAHFEGR